MSPLETIVTSLLAEIDRIVDRKVEEKLPEMIRAVDIHEAPAETESLVGALEVAKLLGRDLSTSENIRRAKKHVYNLARQRLIPSVRVSPRCLKFDLTRVRQKLADRSVEEANKAA